MGFDMLQMATGFDARCFTPMPDPSSVVRSLAESGPARDNQRVVNDVFDR